MEEVVIAYGIDQGENGTVLAIGSREHVDEWVIQNCAKRSFWVARYRVGEVPQFPAPYPTRGEAGTPPR